MSDTDTNAPAHRRVGRYIYTSAGFALVIGFVLSSLSAAGIVAMNLAILLLAMAFFAGVAGLYFAEPIWGVQPRHRISIWLSGSAFLAVICVGVGFYEYQAQPVSDNQEIHGIAEGVKALLAKLTNSRRADEPKPFPQPPASLMVPPKPLKLLSSLRRRPMKPRATPMQTQEVPVTTLAPIVSGTPAPLEIESEKDCLLRQSEYQADLGYLIVSAHIDQAIYEKDNDADELAKKYSLWLARGVLLFKKQTMVIDGPEEFENAHANQWMKAPRGHDETGNGVWKEYQAKVQVLKAISEQVAWPSFCSEVDRTLDAASKR